MNASSPAPLYEVIVPNFNARFSGITATVAAVAPHQMRELSFATVGHPLPAEAGVPRLSWAQFFRLTGQPLPDGRPRIFHARRNIEMLWGLIFKHVFRRKLHLLFTSTAQRAHSRYTRFLYNRMDTLITTSHRAGSWLKRPPSAVVPHGVDTAFFHPATDRAAAWQATGFSGVRGVGIFGRVRPQKGVDVFVRAMCEVLPDAPGWTAVIVGETTPKFRAFERELKELISQKGLTDRFVWAGKRPFGELPKLFQAMSLAVCASRNEGFGLTCLEAMASGVPVVATQTGGFEMVVRPNIDGHIVPCGDAPALAHAAQQVMADETAPDRMGAVARERVLESFTIGREAAALNAVYRKIWAEAATR